MYVLSETNINISHKYDITEENLLSALKIMPNSKTRK